jgi:hypothetical protein
LLIPKKQQKICSLYLSHILSPQVLVVVPSIHREHHSVRKLVFFENLRHDRYFSNVCPFQGPRTKDQEQRKKRFSSVLVRKQ